MRDANFTRQERFLIQWLRFLTLVFFGAGLIIGFSPDLFFNYLNDIGRVFFHYYSSSLPNQDWDFWRMLSVVLMGMLAYIAFLSQSDWLRYYRFVPLLILVNGSCLFGFLSLLLSTPPHFFYIVGAMVDGLLFLFTWYYYAQAIKSRPTITPH